MVRTKKTTEEIAIDDTKNSEKKAKKARTEKKKITTRKPRTAKKNEEAPKEEAAAVADNNVQTAIAAEEQTIEVGQKEEISAEEKPLTVVKETEVKPIDVVKLSEVKQPEVKQIVKISPLPTMKIRNIVELAQAPQRNIILTDQQIQQLTIEELEKRHQFLEEVLMNVLDYDVVISDTNIWLELLIGHSSSHSDPRVNARLQFERQLEFISKLTKYRGGRFVIMGETYEEVDRFASMQDPANHNDADWSDNIVCLNTAARLAKRLMLAQQKENRLRILGIGAESHHAAFADPAIVRKVAELFAQGKKVLLMTNDASVAIRAMGICDDLQYFNNISDEDWDAHYAPLRPMVFTFDDLKLLDFYTRQYHYIQMAAGQPWLCDVPTTREREKVEPLKLCMDAFRPGDKRRGDNLFVEPIPQKAQPQKQNNQQKQQNNQKQNNQQKQQNNQKQNNQPKVDVQPKSDNLPKGDVLSAADIVKVEVPQAETEKTDTEKVENAENVEQKPNKNQRRKPQRGSSKSKKAASQNKSENPSVEAKSTE